MIYSAKINQQIADEIFLFINTAKKHIQSAYLNFDAGSGSTAVASLRELMLK